MEWAKLKPKAGDLLVTINFLCVNFSFGHQTEFIPGAYVKMKNWPQCKLGQSCANSWHKIDGHTIKDVPVQSFSQAQQIRITFYERCPTNITC